MKIILLILAFNFLFSNEIYKEIKIYDHNIENVSFLTSIGIDLDHIHRTNDYIQFAINSYDLSKLIIHNIEYEVIHDNLEEYYVSRLDNDYFDRDFDLGSMGGYYTFEEIESNLDELSNMYPDIISEKVSIGSSLEGRNIWAIKISDNYEVDENEIPEHIISSVKASFSGYKIEEVEVSETVHGINYEFEIEKGKSEMAITIDSNGKIIHKESEDDDERD